MNKPKKILLTLVLVCIILPQFILFYTNEPKKQKFEVKSKSSRHNVYVLQKPKSPDGNPSGFNLTKIEQNKHKQQLLRKSTEEKSLEKAEHRVVQKENQFKKDYDDLMGPLMSSLNDELPLYNPDYNCSDTYTTFQTHSYCLPTQKQTQFFQKLGKVNCLKEGTASVRKNRTECYCKIRWHGQSCSMHDVAYSSGYPRDVYAYLVSSTPRRVINAFPFSHEFDMLETRLHELSDAVDLYIILESNYTASGHPRTRLLLNKLKSGYLKEYQHKIMYLSLGFFPKKGYYDGWVMDALLRNYIGEGLKRIKNLNENDVFVLNDADELPKREALLFLKLHHGYPQPIGFYLVHNIYGFYWRGRDKLSHVFGACTVSMLLHFFNWEPYRLRSASTQMNRNHNMLEHFKLKHYGNIREWSFGSEKEELASGWHCSWCFKPQGIKLKLDGAHWSDLPRWGAYPKKTTLEYIRNLTVNGLWFDDRTRLLDGEFRLSDWFAPKYMQENLKRFRHLLINS